MIDDVTAGAAATAAIGIDGLRDDAPFAVNDCDHAFDAAGIDAVVDRLARRECDAALLGFRATSPAFSYVRFDADGRVGGTVEKEVVSAFAIAGCYLFADRSVFRTNYERYRADCTYPELFLSGVYNTLLDAGGTVAFHELRRHVPFGTPDEMARVAPGDLESLLVPGTARASEPGRGARASAEPE